MGMFGSRCRENHYPPPAPPVGQPNPENYTIVKCEDFVNACVVEVKYPDALNYEGRKVMVYKMPLSKVLTKNAGKMDPHFANDGSAAPFARFEPTEAGWSAALAFARTL